MLSSYRIPLDPPSEHETRLPELDTFSVTATKDVIDPEAGTRTLKLEVYHPGLIWTVLDFDAQVLSWELDDNPPAEHARHVVKEASFYGEDRWTLDLIVALPPNSTSTSSSLSDHSIREEAKIPVHYVGLIEKAMWPGKVKEQVPGEPAMALFEKLDPWIAERTGGSWDVMLLGSVGGVVHI
jgi:hypothetical protein